MKRANDPVIRSSIHLSKTSSLASETWAIAFRSIQEYNTTRTRAAIEFHVMLAWVAGAGIDEVPAAAAAAASSSSLSFALPLRLQRDTTSSIFIQSSIDQSFFHLSICLSI